MGNLLHKKSPTKPALHNTPTSLKSVKSRKSFATNQDSQPVDSVAPVRFSKREIKLLRTYLKGFEDSPRPARPEELEIVVQHWNQLNLFMKSPMETEDASSVPLVDFFDTFYHKLFALEPSVQPLFRSSVQCKAHALMGLISGITTTLEQDSCIARLTQLARQHVLYGVKCEYFNAIGLALVQTLEDVAPLMWSQQVASAWSRVFCHVSVLMLTQMDQQLHQLKWPRPSFLPRPAASTGSAVASESGTADLTVCESTSSHSSRSRASNRPRRRAQSTGTVPSQIPTASDGITKRHTLSLDQWNDQPHPSSGSAALPNAVYDLDQQCPYSGQAFSSYPKYVPLDQQQRAATMTALSSRRDHGKSLVTGAFRQQQQQQPMQQASPSDGSSGCRTDSLRCSRRSRVIPLEDPEKHAHAMAVVGAGHAVPVVPCTPNHPPATCARECAIGCRPS